MESPSASLQGGWRSAMGYPSWCPSPHNHFCFSYALGQLPKVRGKLAMKRLLGKGLGSEKALLAGVGEVRSNGEVRLGVYIAYLSGLAVPVILIVLYNTKGVHPEIADTKSCVYVDCILNSLWQQRDFDT